MGVLELVHMPPDHAALWVRMDNSVLLANDTFGDWTGFQTKDVSGNPLKHLIMGGGAELQELLTAARTRLAVEHKRQMTRLFSKDMDEKPNVLDKMLSKKSRRSSLQLTDGLEAKHSVFINVTEDAGNDSNGAFSAAMEAAISIAHKFSRPIAVDAHVANAGEQLGRLC
jgi:hypothetical protein